MFGTLCALLKTHNRRQQQRLDSEPNMLKRGENNHDVKNDEVNSAIPNATNTKNTESQECIIDYNNIGKHLMAATNETTYKNCNQLNNIINNNNFNIDDNDTEDFTKIKLRKTPNTLDLTYRASRERRKLSENYHFNSITEECEYDSDIGKFNCKNSEFDVTSSEQSSLSTPGGLSSLNDYNNLNISTPSYIDNEDNLNICDNSNKTIIKKIEFFDQNYKIINRIDVVDDDDNNGYRNLKNESCSNMLSSSILLTIFILTCFTLYLFPISN